MQRKAHYMLGDRIIGIYHAPGRLLGGGGSTTHELGGDDWRITKLSDNDFNNREYGRQYELGRWNGNGQGIIAGQLSLDDMRGLRDLLAITILNEAGR